MIIELIDWNGGEMPVEKGTLVLVVHRNGFIFRVYTGNVIEGNWSHNGGPNDIIAYKVLK